MVTWWKPVRSRPLLPTWCFSPLASFLTWLSKTKARWRCGGSWGSLDAGPEPDARRPRFLPRRGDQGWDAGGMELSRCSGGKSQCCNRTALGHPWMHPSPHRGLINCSGKHFTQQAAWHWLRLRAEGWQPPGHTLSSLLHPCHHRDRSLLRTGMVLLHVWFIPPLTHSARAVLASTSSRIPTAPSKQL